MITVVGLGFVGLTSALGFCEKGFKVYGYDTDNQKKSQLAHAEIPFYEPHLEDALKRHTASHSFELIDDLAFAVGKSKAVFCCVGTPSLPDGSADLQYLYSAIESILPYLKHEYKVIVIKSTVPPSTTKEKIKLFIEKRGFTVGKDIGLAVNPEFLREGHAWEDFMHPDRIVIGVEDRKSEMILREWYSPFDCSIHVVTYTTAEFIKYLSNTLLSTLVSYANEMSMIADLFGDIDIPGSFRILHEDKRWHGQPAKMTDYVYPGCGFGGYCLPKDTAALYMQARAKGFDSGGLRNVIDVNEKIKNFFAQKVETSVAKTDVIGILGLSFKANSDDVRDSPAKSIIVKLHAKGFNNIVAYDPMAMKNFEDCFQLDIEYAKNLKEVVEKSDCLLLLTAWKEFETNKTLLLSKTLFDFRYFLKR